MVLISLCRETILIVDREDRIIAILAGRPSGKDWEETVQKYLQALARAKESLQFGKKCDRRGPFRTIAVGVSYGGGQTVSDHVSLITHALILFSFPELYARHSTTSQSSRNSWETPHYDA